MNLIIDFYKGLDTLNLIIFWGIIIVIVLLLIFSFILINKNKKLKKIVEQSNKYEEDIPIKEESTIENNIETIEKPTIEIPKSQEQIIEAKEIINNYEKEEKQKSNIININNKNPEPNEPNIEKNTYEINRKTSIEIPNKPYQRNVLREMSLSQTSPIGINRQVQKNEKKNEMIKDLNETLNHEEHNSQPTNDKITPTEQNDAQSINVKIERELNNIENYSPRKTEIIQNITQNKEDIHLEIPKQQKVKIETPMIEETTEELLNNQLPKEDMKVEKSSSGKYLEEVSRKLAEAEIPDDIERTDYELQQEENAIISYKELMEKKDTIQTIEEEDAIISIEELMNRKNKETEGQEETTKLYNITETEENDDFIKELKQFRKDL